MQIEDHFLDDHHRKMHHLDVIQNTMREKVIQEELPWEEDFYDEPVNRPKLDEKKEDWTDGKVLKFRCYFKEPVVESREETERTRFCFLYFFLEDFSLEIFEPHQDNSGMFQGEFLKRQRVTKDNGTYLISFHDLEVGSEVEIFGRVFVICDCDTFTREFLQSQGLNTEPERNIPENQYFARRPDRSKKHANITGNDWEFKRFHEYQYAGRSSVPSNHELQYTKGFLENDRKILRFYCVWDDRERLHGDLRRFTLHHFLSDDTTEINEVLPRNSGHDPFPAFVKRQRIPKNPFASKQASFTHATSFHTALKDPTKAADSQHEYYNASDFMVGKTIDIFNRKMLIYDCDTFTKQYYQRHFGLSNIEPVNVETYQEREIEKRPPPAHSFTFGSEADSLSSWKSIIPKPPKKDIVKLLERERSIIKYSADLVATNDEDAIRKFVITCYLADDTIGIYEPPINNAGIVGGRFLKRQHVKKPDGTVMTADDIQVGQIVELNKYKFRILAKDESQCTKQHVPMLSTLKERPQMNQSGAPRRDVQEHAFCKFKMSQGRMQKVLENAFRFAADTTHDGLLGSAEFRNIILDRFKMELTEEEIAALQHRFFLDRGQRIEPEEFIKIIQGTSTRYYSTGLLK